MQSPSLNTRAPKTSTIFILSETWHNKHKRLNNQIFHGDIVCAVCTSHTNLKWLQERNTLDEGLIHPPLLCVIFNNQPVKCGSILRQKRGFNLSVLILVIWHAKDRHAFWDSPGPTGRPPVLQRLWQLAACCTWEPARQNFPCCRTSQRTHSLRPSPLKYHTRPWKW